MGRLHKSSNAEKILAKATNQEKCIEKSQACPLCDENIPDGTKEGLKTHLLSLHTMKMPDTQRNKAQSGVSSPTLFNKKHIVDKVMKAEVAVGTEIKATTSSSNNVGKAARNGPNKSSQRVECSFCGKNVGLGYYKRHLHSMHNAKAAAAAIKTTAKLEDQTSEAATGEPSIPNRPPPGSQSDLVLTFEPPPSSSQTSQVQPSLELFERSDNEEEAKPISPSIPSKPTELEPSESDKGRAKEPCTDCGNDVLIKEGSAPEGVSAETRKRIHEDIFHKKPRIMLESCEKNDEPTASTIQKSIKRPFKCKFCGERFLKKNNLGHHTNIVHRSSSAVEDIKTETKCGICGKELSSRAKVKRHMDNLHGDPGSKEACSECGKTFGEKGNLKRHLENVHGIGKLLSCPRSECDVALTGNT